MTRPDVEDTTETLYAGLPELYRHADEAQGAGDGQYPLLRYLSGVGDQLAPIRALAERFAYVALDELAEEANDQEFGVPAPWQRYGSGTYGSGTYGDGDTADLVDPVTADAGWLPWLAQLLGARAAVEGLTIAETRDLLQHPAQVWAHGSPPAIRREALRALAPGAYCDIRPHWGGDPFTIAVVTKNSETGDPQDVLDSAALEQPAGYDLVSAYLEDIAPG